MYASQGVISTLPVLLTLMGVTPNLLFGLVRVILPEPEESDVDPDMLRGPV